MGLTPGTRLGVYEITAQIGVGGMGEVYRATDSNLKRSVAIKVLPASVAGDADRLARFQREAEVLAALNHPNIAAIYGLEKTSDFTALVMELVEGEDLSQKLEGLRAQQGQRAEGKGLPLNEALPIAKQIADALEAAHEQGIIHRDLKPANIKVRADGTVKVLDFGLAKAIEAGGAGGPGAAGSLSMSPTITTPAMTQAGMILGTAAYMSPEQARGKTVDKRADIWAFGCVLYEMLTGQRAFGGEDVADVLSRVLQREPDFEALPPATPARIRSIAARCLVKDPRQRLRDMGDVRLALEGAFETAASSATTVAPLQARGTSFAWMAALAVAVLGMIAFAIPAVRHLRETPRPALPETRLDVVTPATDRPEDFALSPDGRQIVFVASAGGAPRVWLRSLATTTAQPLTGTDGATSPFWSPDSRSIGFFAGGALKRLDLNGGAPQTLATIANSSGGTWGATGVILVATTSSLRSAMVRVAATGGAVTSVTKVIPQQTSQRTPRFLPDGHRFLFFTTGTPEVAGIYLGTLDDGALTRLTPADSGGMFLSDRLRSSDASGDGGWLLWVRAGTLVAQRLDVAKAVLTGEPITLADGVGAASVATTGLVAYRAGGSVRRQLTWVDRSGTTRGTIGDADDDTLNQPRVSPDGRRVAVYRTVQGNTDLWLLDSGRMIRLTFDAANEQFPVWSPDGARIAFESSRSGHPDIFQKPTNGGGIEEPVVNSDQTKAPSSWSKDGRFLLYRSIDPQTNSDLWVVPMEGEHQPWVFLNTPFTEARADFSPDGRWVAYESNESGRMEIYVRPFVPPSHDASAGTRTGASTPAAGQSQVSTAGGIAPVWRPDGKELYYLNQAGTMMAAPITVSGATLSPGAPVALFPAHIVGGGLDTGGGRQYDVAPDGRFLINTVLSEGAAPITLLMNWNSDAKQ